MKCQNRAQSMNLLKTKVFFGINVDVSPHKTLNSSKGVIRCRDLADISPEEILQDLQSQGVIKVDRLTIKRNETIIPTSTFFLTFARDTPPSEIKAGYLNIKVARYIPKPLRCFNCQKFGHGSGSCRMKIVCYRCGQGDHGGEGCTDAHKCANCRGSHMASSRDCPIYKQEQEVQKVKVENGISFVEARERVKIPITASHRTYAAATKVSKVTTETQTDLTWISDDPPGPQRYQPKIRTNNDQNNK